MRVTKLVERTFLYCNWCNKELHAPCTEATGEDGIVRHFHSEYNGGKPTCLDQWTEMDIARGIVRRWEEENKMSKREPE